MFGIPLSNEQINDKADSVDQLNSVLGGLHKKVQFKGQILRERQLDVLLPHE